MSQFSNKLKEIFSVKSVDKLQLSHALSIDRALLYRYLNDQSFPEQGFLRELQAELLLTPYEYRELLRAYEMTRLGEDVFQNRKIVGGIISNIYRQNEKNLGTHLALEPAGVLQGPITSLTNTDGVYLALHQIFSDPRSHQVMITMQPDQEFVYKSVFPLLIEQARHRAMRIDHIVRFQSKTRDNPATYNLNVFARIVPPIYACNYYTESQYFVHYYYNNQVAVDERAMELYPNIIVTPWCVCMLSYNYNSAVVVQDVNMAALYRSNFLSVQEKTACFLKDALSPSGESTLLLSKITKEPYFEAIFKAHPSISLGGDEQHYTDNYSINSKEDEERVAGLLRRYRIRTASMNSELHRGRRDFFTMSGLRSFIATGRFTTSTVENMIPMTHDAVRAFLSTYVERVQSHPRFCAHLVKEDVPGSLSGDFGIYIINNNSMIIEKARSDIFLKRHVIEVTERSIIDAFSEYLEEGVPFEESIISREQTVSFLKDLIAVNLDIDRLNPLF